jgi:putative DNA primase/helicase
LIQRFQVLVYPDQPSTWRLVERWPDSPARRAAFDVFARLAHLDLPKVTQAQSDDGEMPYLRFGTEAQELFNGWYSALITRARQSEAEAFESHLVKYAKLMPALALAFHLVEEPSGGPVSLRAAQMSAAWCDLLEAHARRIYHACTAADIVAARALLARLKAGALPTPFVARDVYRKQWAGIGTPPETEAALDVLEEHGWVRRLEMPVGPGGGHPRVEFHPHPVLVGPKRAAA